MANNKINIAFVLGAGASVDDGAPVMDNFLDKAKEILRNSDLFRYNIIKSAFEDVFNSFADVRGIYSKSYLNLDNIEILFGAVEMGIMLEKYGNRNLHDILRLKRSLITSIVQTLESSMKLIIEKDKVLPPANYRNFIAILKFIMESHKNYYGFNFITFNYDVGLDLSLLFHEIPFDYFNQKGIESNIPLLKLHGSINWYKENDDSEISVLKANDSHYSNLFNPGIGFNCIGTQILEKDKFPFIIPPTWNKYEYHSQLKIIWKKAAQILSEAEIIFIIGYSFPETDLFFKYLYSIGSDSNTSISKIYVINPDANLESKFGELFSQNLLGKRRLIFKNIKFSESIGFINSELLDLSKF
jgi:hypothetical protein